MIALQHALLCLNCEAVVWDSTDGPACPGCASHHTWPIARWLNRAAPTPPEETPHA